MLDMTLDELRSFYPSDEIIRGYGEALMKYSEKGFIYSFTHEEEQELKHNTENNQHMMKVLSKLKQK